MLFRKAVKKYSDTDSGSQLSDEEIVLLYQITHVDVSNHREKLKMGTSDLVIYDDGWKKVSRN